jgi:S-adenosylmethionine decarboxylase
LDLKHFTLDLIGADKTLLDDEDYIRSILKKAIGKANASLIQLRSHKFDPQGLTAFAILAESHVSIHTWPEINFAAVDFFTCGEHTKPEEACEYISSALKAKSHSIFFVERFSP